MAAPRRAGDEPLLIHPVILCGGAGQRMWPLSSDARPKPFLSLLSERSMIEETAARVVADTAAPVTFAALTVVGSARQEAALRHALPEARLVLEPFPRNSAPAVAAATLLAEPDPLLLILPADHYIGNLAAFHAAIAKGAERARSGDLVTFGVVPDHPSTAYGYIEAEPSSDPVRRVLAFVEKPDRAIAEAYAADGRHYWNAGIFLFRGRDMVTALERHAPDILGAVRAALEGTGAGDRASPGNVVRLARDPFARCRAQSIDHAVMERASNIAVVPVDMDWSDIGDYRVLRERTAAVSDATVAEGPVVAENVRASYLRSEGPRLAVKDVSDIAVVASHDAVLVVPLASASAIKPLVERAIALGAASDVSAATREAVIGWLRTTLASWAHQAWDERRGGFVEALNLDGTPDFDAPKRTRVQARQVYAFARAGVLGLVPSARARDLVAAGLDHLLGRLRHRDGGWVHAADREGRAVEPARDLYDHAFIALAGAAALEADGDERARALMDDAFAVIEGRFADRADGGYVENLDLAVPHRCSNSHMHLLEASLEAHRVTGEPAHLDRARAIVELFETALFGSRSGAVLEHFAADWRPAEPRGEARVEPGHCYEWATLLAQFEAAEGRDLISWRRRLIGFADRFGCDPDTGFALNAVTVAGAPIDADRRLWPQLEMLRARLHHPGTAAPGAADRLAGRIMATYLADGPAGGWMDEYRADGAAKSAAVPASMLYHLMTAFAPLAAAASLTDR